MRKFVLIFAVLVAAGQIRTSYADGPAAPTPAKPAAVATANGRPVYDMATLQHTPGVTFTKTAVPTTRTHATTTASTASSASSTYSSGYGFGYIYNSYYQSLGDVYQYAYTVTAWWYGVPLCVQSQTSMYVYPSYIPVRSTMQLYLSGYGTFQSYYTAQGWSTYGGNNGYVFLSSGCYGTITGDTWYNLSSFACGASYYCSGSAVASWTDYY